MREWGIYEWNKIGINETNMTLEFILKVAAQITRITHLFRYTICPGNGMWFTGI